MHEKIANLLPDGLIWIKCIECEHTDKQNSQDTDDPRQPLDYFGG